MAGMDLKTFVADTIVQIIEGVKAAQERTKGTGGYVNPPIASMSANEMMKQGLFVAAGGYAQLMKFDVAINATEGTQTGGKVGVVVGVLSLGAGGQSNAESVASSRVQFCIPLSLPVAQS